MSLKKTPFFELRSGSVDTLLFVVKTTDLDALRTELTRRFEATPEFFANDVVAIDVRRLADTSATDRVSLDDSPRCSTACACARSASSRCRRRRGPRNGRRRAACRCSKHATGAARRSRRKVTASARHRGRRRDRGRRREDAAARRPRRRRRHHRPAVAFRPAGLCEGRSRRAGLVSYGAEVIAEGNIHIYAPLRGRALAGVHGNHDARIFCTCLEPELISIAGIYRTTENPLARRCARQVGADLARRRKTDDRTVAAHLTLAAPEANGAHSGRQQADLIDEHKVTVMAKIIVVTSGKGGVGKTTTSASFCIGARVARPQDGRDRLRRRPAQPRPHHGLRAPRGVRPDQRDPGRSQPEPGADQGQEVREPVHPAGLADA